MEEILGVKGLNLLLCSFLLWFGLVLFNFVLYFVFVCVFLNLSLTETTWRWCRKKSKMQTFDSVFFPDVTSLHTSESSLALNSILKMMLYVAAKHEAGGFVEDLFRTKAGKAVMNSFSKKDELEETGNQSNLHQQLFSYLENISKR